MSLRDHVAVAVPPEGGGEALYRVAQTLAEGLGLPVELISVVQVEERVDPHTLLPEPSERALERVGREVGAKLRSEARAVLGQGVEVRFRALTGVPAEAILAHIEECPPVFLVMATRGQSGLKRALLGSVAEGVTRRATCPVVVVPPRIA